MIGYMLTQAIATAIILAMAYNITLEEQNDDD